MELKFDDMQKCFKENEFRLINLEKATTTDMAGWLATGLLFLRSKDSLIALPKS